MRELVVGLGAREADAQPELHLVAHGAEAKQQLLHLEGLEHVVSYAFSHRGDCVVGVGEGRHQHHSRGRLQAASEPEQAQPIDAGQANVREQNVEVLRRQQALSLRSVIALGHEVARVFQSVAHRNAHDSIVFDEEQLQGWHGAEATRPPTACATKRTRMRDSLVTLAGVFTRLGCLSFGGPVAHLGYLHAEFVLRRRWVDEHEFADLVALCQFLPGPASSQLVFALGMTRRGLAGALVASVCFTLPSLVLMIAFAAGVAKLGTLQHAGWLHGLKLAAVGVVAQAVWSMGQKLTPDRARLSIALVAAAIVLAAPHAFTQVLVIALGGLVGWHQFRSMAATTPVTVAPARPHVAATAALVLWVAALVGLPVLVEATGARTLAQFTAFFRSGSLVFGGGHVVLPLLRAEVVPTGWLGDDQFLAGYAAAQAVPGPLFTFAGYLGAAMTADLPWWLNGVWCALAIFLPAWLLIGGALPFWARLRVRASVQAGLMGANAAVVGVLLAALYDPVFVSAVTAPRDVAAALLGFGLLVGWRAPPALVVIAFAAAGQWVFAA